MNDTAPREAYLTITGLSKMFGDFVALRDISLEVFDQEFVCFLGPSGCGKTTLLRAVAGLDIQTSGMIVQAGRDISALPPSERDFGIVFQSYALFPNLTSRRNIAYGLENRKLSRSEIEARVSDLLDLVGLPDQGEKYPAQLSGGQQQRVALARAMATSPGLLLLDEPLSALDARVRVHLRGEIKELQRRMGVTTIMVTHDQEEALTMADRIVVMNQGVIDQIGTPEEIYSRPASAFVADFIGTMNFLAGRVTGPETVEIAGAPFRCTSGGFAPGDAVSAAIRPEDIVAENVGDDDENVMTATIRHLEFLGAFYRADLADERLGGKDLFADFSVNFVRRQNIRTGDTIRVKFPDRFIKLYRREAGDG